MRYLIYILPTLFIVMGCQSKAKDKTDLVLRQAEAIQKKNCDKNECPCDTPLGTIAHGSKVTVYEKDKAACNEGCGKSSKELTCNNGKFEQELTGLFFKCVVEDCPACLLGPNLILSGESIDAYSTDTVGCGESCEDVKQRRTCTLGNLSGTEPFKFFSCKRKVCRCLLPDNSAYLSLNGTVKLYSAEQASCGSTCEANLSQVRTCVSFTPPGGVESFRLNGLAANRYRTCAEATNCFCTLPNGLGVLAHGESRVVSTAETVPCGETCTSRPSVSVQCDNGIFRNNANLSLIVDFTTATYLGHKYECSVDACVSCAVPGTSTAVPHGDSYTFAKVASVGCAGTCEFKSRTCSNGTFLGDTTYVAPSCARRQCTCVLPDDTTKTIPVGSSFLFYSKSIALCGETCAQFSDSRTCTEVPTGGSFSYSFNGNAAANKSSCRGSTGCSCTLPNSLGTIADEKTVILTSLPTVACGTSCDTIPSLSVKCKNGTFIRTTDSTPVDTTAPTFAFKHFCQQASCSSCQLPGYGSIAAGASLTLYSKPELVCGDIPENFTFVFKCENGVLLKNSTIHVPQAGDSWSTSYSLNCPGCPLPWGGATAEGTSVNGYKFFGTVLNGCGRGCKMEQRRCLNGVLGGDPTYNMQACDNQCNMEGGGAPPRLCLLRWQNSFVTPDAQIPIWNKRVVGCGDSCQNHFKLSRCQMENGIFDVPFDYMYQACTEVCP